MIWGRIPTNYLDSKSSIPTLKGLHHTYDRWSDSLSDPPSLDACKLSWLLSLSDGELSELGFGTTTADWLCKVVASLLLKDSYWWVVSIEATYDIPNFCPWDSPGQNPCRTFFFISKIPAEHIIIHVKLKGFLHSGYAWWYLYNTAFSFIHLFIYFIFVLCLGSLMMLKH